MKRSDHSKPAYLRVYESLRNDIVSGVYATGARLPSKRELAAERHVSVVTVTHAYELLVREGYVHSKERSGYFVIFHDTADSVKSHSALHAVPVPHSMTGQEAVPTFPFDLWAKALRRVLNQQGERLLIKCPNTGSPVLREAICQYLARCRGMQVSPEQVVIGSGAEYLYGLLVQLLGPSTVIAIEDPSYAQIERVYQAHGMTCQLLKLGRDGIQSEALSQSNAQVLHITPYRSFPSGVTATASKRREYLRWARRTDGLIVEDDFESEFTTLSKPEETVFSLAGGERVIYINSFSKTVSPALRVGYMVLPISLLTEFDRKVGFYSCSVPTLEQYALAQLLEQGEFERHINRVRREKRKAVEKNFSRS